MSIFLDLALDVAARSQSATCRTFDRGAGTNRPAETV
jgi:hypothetical protein